MNRKTQGSKFVAFQSHKAFTPWKSKSDHTLSLLWKTYAKKKKERNSKAFSSLLYENKFQLWVDFCFNQTPISDYSTANF